MSIRVCEQRNIIQGTEQDVADALFEGALDESELLNILGEEFVSGGCDDFWMIDLSKRLTPMGKMYVYALANWCLWEGRGEKRMPYHAPQYPDEVTK